MQVKIITIPFNPEKRVFEDDDLNTFLGSRNVTRMQSKFFEHNGRPFWTVFMEMDNNLPAQERKTGKIELSAVERQRYDQLARWRRETAESLGMPVYVVATNRQLADVARKKPTTIEALRQISGFGKKKVDQHGKAITALIDRIIKMESIPEKSTAHVTERTSDGSET